MIEIIRNLIEFFFYYTKSYGFSLIILSLISSLVISFITKLFSSFPGRYEEYEKILGPKKLKINKKYNGKERFFKTQKLYKKYSYSPLISIYSLIPLLVQLPFFVLFFYSIQDYPSFISVEFGPISDLSLPDHLLWNINILPLLMVMFNLCTSLFTKQTLKKDIIKVLALNFLFLFLLYNLSSALLLYYTVNNLILLIATLYSSSDFKLVFLSNNISIFNFYLFIKSRFKNNNFLFLIPILYSLNFFSNSFYEISGVLVFLMTLILLLITFLIYFAVKKIIRYSHLSIFISSLIVFDFFVFNIINEFFQIHSLLGFKYLLIIHLIFILIISYILFLFKERLASFNSFFNIFFIVASIISFSQILLLSIPKQNKINLIEKNELNKNLINSKISRNIIYIVLDSYPSEINLKKYYGYDNTKFLNQLDSLGFIMPKNSRANYPQTITSIASTLNLKYINNIPKRLSNPNYLYNIINKNAIASFLKTYGYEYIHFSSGITSNKYSSIADVNYNTYNSGIYDDIYAFFRVTALKKVIDKLTSTKYKAKAIIDKFMIIKNINLNEKKPKFIFAHIMSPHPPYVFDKNGIIDVNTKTVDKIYENPYLNTESYVNQLIYTNDKIINLVNMIMNSSFNEPIVIIQSDHGSFFTYKSEKFSLKEKVNERMKNFNALYLPSLTENTIYDSISNVNTFRVILKEYFNQNIDLLEDKSYWSTYEKMFELEDITKLLE